MWCRRLLALGACGLHVGLADTAEPVTPLQKVVELISNLKAEVETEGRAEAATYDEFACFCKSKSTSLSDEIKNGKDRIDSLSAEIESKTAEKDQAAQDMIDTKKKKEEYSARLSEETAACSKDKAEYEATNADLTKAISSLQGATRALSAAKFPAAAGLLAVKQTVQKSLDLAEAMKLVDEGPKWQDAVSFLQDSSTVDPDDPEYKYHSQGIIHVLQKLHKELEDKKAVADVEWAKAEQTCKDTMQGLSNDISSAEAAIVLFQQKELALAEGIGAARSSLVQSQATLQDDNAYMEDLTSLCEQRAADWDQRSTLRHEELSALSKALEILTTDVAANEGVNERALLQRSSLAAPVRPHADEAAAVPSFLQERRTRKVRLLAAGRAAAAAGVRRASPAQGQEEGRRAGALLVLQQEGARLGSSALATLAGRAAADPFLKIKGLLQDLLERLLTEATEEATKKGFCDQEIGKAKQDRTYRKEEAMKVATEIHSLEAKEEMLNVEIEELTGAIAVLESAIAETTRIRAQEHDENVIIIDKAKAGNKAVSQALLILKSFYKDASNEKVPALFQIRASPVDEHTSGPGFAGAYQGKQAASEGIVGILEVLQSDFARTIDTTTRDEADAHAKFVELDRASQADLAGKTTKKALDEEDLETARRTRASKMGDLQGTMDMLDAALKRLEELTPTCIDTGMSFEERVAKREEEVAALKRALCMLDADNVEEECKS